MNAFPAAGDYYKAVQAPGRCFTVPKLQAAEFVWDSLGPTLARGSSAVVFQASIQGRPQALRCYIREDASSRDRYSALDTYLAGHDLSPYVSGTTWLDGAITVNRAPWPVLTMDWIDGRTLNEYVDFLVAGSNAAALTTLAGRWRELVALLQRSEFAHGDLQHGNVMVDQDGQLRLVDFNGVWIPQLTGQSPPTEFGHPNYQHPLHHNWDRWLDTFSALVIYISLVALARIRGSGWPCTTPRTCCSPRPTSSPRSRPRPGSSWPRCGTRRSTSWPGSCRSAAARSGCPTGAWRRPWSSRPRLRPCPPVPDGQRWWEQRPASGAGPRLPAPAPASPSRPRPQPAPPRARGPRPAPGPARRPAAAPPGGPPGPRCPPRPRCPRRSAWRAPDRCRS